MGIHKEGFLTIILSFIILSGLAIFILVLFPYWPLLFQFFMLIAFLFWVAIISFFRFPKFKVLPNENLVISPADGKVVVIERVRVDEFINEERIQISVFMSPLNTHLNRYPISGTIEYYKYHSGKHLMAWLPKSSTDNERATIVVNNGKCQILIRQIAGAVARRIVCYANSTKAVQQGDELGFIKFGSRVDVFVPISAIINVELDQPVKAGKTILAEI